MTNERAYPAHLTFSALAAAAGHTVAQGDCLKRAEKGECYLCGKAPHKYGVKMCFKCPEGKRAAVQALNAQRTAWRAAHEGDSK